MRLIWRIGSKGETKTTTTTTTIAETTFSSLDAISLKRSTVKNDKQNSPVSSPSLPAPQYSPSSPSRHHCRCFRLRSYDPPADHQTGWRACGQAGGRPCPSGTYRGGLARSLLGWALLGIVSLFLFLYLFLFLLEGEMDWIGLVMLSMVCERCKKRFAAYRATLCISCLAILYMVPACAFTLADRMGDDDKLLPVFRGRTKQRSWSIDDNG
jgi:hypothetical protein